MSLTSRIVLSMVLAMSGGILLKVINDAGYLGEIGQLVLISFFTEGLLDVIGQIFIASLRLVIVPLVFFSLVCGVVSISSSSRIGTISLKTLSLYLLTTAIAISIALTFALLFQPGVGVDLALPTAFQSTEAPSLKEVLINIFPTNPVAAMAEGNMLQIIVFSLLFGIALKSLGSSGDALKASFETINNVILSLVKMLIELAPYGIFALLFSLFAVQGFSMIGDLAKYFFLLVFVLIFHAFFTYGSLLYLLAQLSPLKFFMKVRSLAIFAFSTSSSSATMPITLDTVKNKLGVNSSIGSFTVPLGATINMDGTAIMQGIATVFISQAYNIDLTMVDYLMVILTATLASIGTAGVPGVGLIMLAMVLEQVGLPVEGIALIIGVDRLLDMTRTAVNVCGDAMVSCVVAKSEDEFNSETFHSEN
ncbi:dicarboxylate/amino acid:cation symporter [Gammaproteobacteria bacterium]|nr:dicarboxylate/amino acid:cation symporter [Gammaproteobacteria bacterium]MDB3994840.1 dicarboxylate/amino acid:cation symporter [Gammaproteobacteria bacterium]MDC0545366.1 dicarboxylate/amino acid:cation symporter [Gammaproteobacteria bacterium]MDC0591012.1 dicarboxylate/amino acid:cation symporter [Gammaproteobacteria bacterium]